MAKDATRPKRSKVKRSKVSKPELTTYKGLTDLEVANDHAKAGLCILPPIKGGDKRPAAMCLNADSEWKQYQNQHPTEAQRKVWFRKWRGFEVVCGQISGGLETLDFDLPEYFGKWKDKVVETDEGKELYDSLTIERTPRGGRHAFYRCDQIEGCQKPAQRIKPETKRDKKSIETLIELKSEGGLIVITPTTGEFSKNGKPYELVQGNFHSIPIITPDQRKLLLTAARALDELPAPESTPYDGTIAVSEDRPGDVFAQRTIWANILNGWKLVRKDEDNVQYYQRPGKSGSGWSATVNYNGRDSLYVFSSNAAPFEANHSYGKFEVFALLHFEGNFSAAASALNALRDIEDRKRLPSLWANDPDIDRLTKTAWKACAKMNENEHLFLRAARVVRKAQDEWSIWSLQEVRSAELYNEMARLAYFFKYKEVDLSEEELAAEKEKAKVAGIEEPKQLGRPSKKKKRIRIRTRPDDRMISNMMAELEKPLPPILRLSEVPIFGKNERLQTKAGYDPNTYCCLNPPKNLTIPPVSTEPTVKELAIAMELFKTILHEFPFDSLASHAHTMAAMIQPFVRNMIDGPTPMYAFDGPSEGIGKTLLMQIDFYPALGTVPLSTLPGTEDEIDKRLLSKLFAAAEIVAYDNVRIGRIVNSEVLSGAILNPKFESRILHKNKMGDLLIRNAWAITGINLEFGGEMARRVVRVRLRAEEEHSWLIHYQITDIMNWVRSHRGEIVWAILTIVQHWIALGRPERKSTVAFGRFEDYSRVIGGILECNEIEGFLSNLEQFYKTSVGRTGLNQILMERWWKVFKGAPVTMREAIEKVVLPHTRGVGGTVTSEDDEDMDIAALGWDERKNNASELGRYIKKHLLDRPIAGYQFVEADATHSVRYRLEKLEKEESNVDPKE